MTTAAMTKVTEPAGMPDMKVSVRQVFGIDSDLEVPAYSEVDPHVPDVDSDYRFDRATTLMGVPTFYVRLLHEPSFGREACRNMRLFVSGSAPLLKETFDEFKSRTGHTILERYGMTEGGMFTSNPYEGERRGGTVGFPLPALLLFASLFVPILRVALCVHLLDQRLGVLRSLALLLFALLALALSSLRFLLPFPVHSKDSEKALHHL